MAEEQDNGAAEVQAMLQDVDQQILTQGYQRAIVYGCSVLTAGGFAVHFPDDLAYKLAALTIATIVLLIHWLRAHTALQQIANDSHLAGKVEAVVTMGVAPAAPAAPAEPPIVPAAAIFAGAPAMKVVPSAVPKPLTDKIDQ